MKPVTSPTSKNRARRIAPWAVIVFAIAGLFALTQDIIITNILAYGICKADPNPKTFIRKTVEYPESVYWEDNIYPGFDEEDRLLMIRNYLDGEHLKTLALNAPDGTIHLFTATPEDWRASQEIKAKASDGNYYEAIEEEAKAIAARGKIMTLQELPQLNFSVVFNPISLTAFQSRYLYSDEVSISENETHQVIAHNRRLMHKFYLLVPDFAGGRYYYPEAICGDGGWLYGFDYSVFTSLKAKYSRFHGMNINNYLYVTSIAKGGIK